MAWINKSDGDCLTAANWNAIETDIYDPLYENLYGLSRKVLTFNFPIHVSATAANIEQHNAIYPILHVGFPLPSGNEIEEISVDASGPYTRAGAARTYYCDYSLNDAAWVNIVNDTSAFSNTNCDLMGTQGGLSDNKVYFRVRSNNSDACLYADSIYVYTVSLKMTGASDDKRMTDWDFFSWRVGSSGFVDNAKTTIKQKKYYAPQNRKITGFYAGGALAIEGANQTGRIEYQADGGGWVVIDSQGVGANVRQLVLSGEITGLNADEIDLRITSEDAGAGQQSVANAGYCYMYWFPIYSYTSP